MNQAASQSVLKSLPIEATPLIDLRNICRTFVTGGGVEVRALRGVNLSIYPGEFVAIIGQSGSGKSTLMNVLGCLDRPTSGSYNFAGRDIKSFDADDLAWLRREAFGFVFQSYNLLANATAEENVEVPAVYAGKTFAERRTRAIQLLSALGLGDRLDHRPTQLSGGQQQRVSIARALMNGGQIILADEPTGALDSKSGAEVMELMETLAREGHTVILITHDSKVAEHADRVIEMRDGEVISDSGATVAPSTKKIKFDVQTMSQPHTKSNLSNVFEAIRMAFRSLWANAFRTFLTLLGVVIGVAAVVALMAVGEGSQKDILDQINAMGSNTLFVRPDWNRAGQRGSSDASSSLTEEDAIAIAEEVPNVFGTLPEIQGNFTVRFGNQDYQTQVTATSQEMPRVQSWPLARGVFFTDEDSKTYAPVAVLGKTVYDKLFPNGEDPLGAYVLIQNIPFQVIGILTSKGASGFGNDSDDVIYVPLRTGGLRLMGTTSLRSITVAVDNVDQISQTESEVIAYLQRIKGHSDFRIFNRAELLDTASEATRSTTILLSSVAAISLLVGGIGVMNIMLVSVTERTREIGIRMATGARQSDILMQFLLEALVVCGVGGLLGISIGIGVGKIIELFGSTIVFSTWPMLLAFGCAASIGLVFGFFPARKAAKLDPVVALANE